MPIFSVRIAFGNFFFIKSFLSETDSKEVNLWCYSVKNNTSEKSVWKELPYLVILYSQFSKIDNHKIQIKNTTFYDSRDLASINMPTFFPNTEIMTNFMGIYLDWHTEISLILPELKKYYKEIKKNKKSMQFVFNFDNGTQENITLPAKYRKQILSLIKNYNPT